VSLGFITPEALPTRWSKNDREPLYEPPTMISGFLWLKTMVQRAEVGYSVFSGELGLLRFQMYEANGIFGGIC